MKALLVVLSCLCLVACTHSQISTKTAFDPQSAKGLAIIGTSGEMDYEVWFARYDPQSRKLDAGSLSGHEGLRHKASKPGYRVIEMDPGTYVLKNVSYAVPNGLGVTAHTVCLNTGTYRFDIAAGEIVYLGDVRFEPGLGGHVGVLAGDLTAAQSALQAYPQVKGTARVAAMQPADFVNGKSLIGGPVCGGYYF